MSSTVLATVSTAATVALVVITYLYVRKTAEMVREAKRTRDLALQPMLAIALVSSGLPGGPMPANTPPTRWVKNIGNAPALDARMAAQMRVGSKAFDEPQVCLGAVGLEERIVPFTGELNLAPFDLAVEMTGASRRGEDPKDVSLAIVLIYSNAHGVQFETSYGFRQDLATQVPAWVLSSQSHRIVG